jgi:hypothetical protein
MKIKPQALGVLLLSGHADSLAAVSERYRAAGGSFHVETMSKPFGLPELAARIKRILMMQGGPSTVVGEGVLATSGVASEAAPQETHGDAAAGALPRGAPSFGTASRPTLGGSGLARLEKQLATLETQMSGVVASVSALRKLLDEVTRSQG